MSIYKYPESKVVDAIAFKKTANGAVRAYVHARDGVGDDTLQTILQTLKNKDFECIPFTQDGKPALEVRGFRRESELITLLSDKQWIDNKPVIEKDKDDEIGWLDWFRKRSMQASGAAMMVADVGFAMYGAKEKSWEDTLAGLSYLGGSATLLAYGRNDQSQLQIRQLAQMILDHAHEKGLKVSDESAAGSIGRERQEGVLKQVDNLFRRNPSEIGNMMYVAAGGLIAKSALQHRALATPRAGMTPKQITEMRKGGWGDTMLGSVTVGSGLLATLVKEKAHDPDAPKKHGLAAVAEWVKESPLRMASYGYIFSTLCHCYTTFTERSEAKRVIKDVTMSALEHTKAQEKLKSIPWRVLFVSATLVGELLLSISSKGHGEGVVSDNSVDNSAVAIAADLIVKQSPGMQDQLIEQMGKFLGRPEVLAIKDEDAVALLRKQVELLRKNPWAQPEPMQPAPAQPLTVATPKVDVPKWQAKVTPSLDKAPQQIQPSV